FQVYHVISTAGTVLLAVAYILPLLYLGWSLFYGNRSDRNPWHAAGLEWETASPPPKENFEKMPVVTGGPYSYGEDAEPQAHTA
ncbi:MAG TPA: cytochrome c oxidase subunit I, partial [Pseudolabrys sp.]|nr:cytochrome c oxidase subunit I [Pseudolabrys sp.]